MTVSLRVKGAVQGVGYRPFIANKASEYGLLGQVKNIGAAVDIIVSGDEKQVNRFIDMVQNDQPAGAFVLDVQINYLNDDDYNFSDFSIVESGTIDLSSELPVFLPDIGICDDCLNEMLDNSNRRFHYPLISCASCGPRFSILDKLPYDRPTTTMSDFEMCSKCSSEYVSGRRRHAQTISCHECGPQMILRTGEHTDIVGTKAVDEAIALLKQNKIIGLKGISGYQLICKPCSDTALKLRSIKGRENKPFAVMFSDIDSIKRYCEVNELEAELLKSSARPIVLLRAVREFSYEVSKDSRYIGAFLPSAGVHRLICDQVGPVICTSANKSGSPMIIDDNEFFETFNDIDGVLYHKRRINMAQDDSVMFVTRQYDGTLTSQFIRRARGYNPLPVILNGTYSDSSVLALGGDLKSTFAIGKKDRIIPSQYIGDLENTDNFDLLKKYIDIYSKIFSFKTEKIICDMHPLYYSTAFADSLSQAGIDKVNVQHHHAHALSVMAENSLDSCIGISFDGTGYGEDGKIWGGEVLLCKGTEYERVSHLSYVKLVGGNNAPKNALQVKKCYDYAAGYDIDNPIIEAALKQDINTYETSGMGRLFDAVSSLLGICDYNSYEGECAVLLEKEAYSGSEDYPMISFDIECRDGIFVADQISLYKKISDILATCNYSKGSISYAFHMAVADYVLNICSIIKKEKNENKVCLSGGVFANRILLTKCIEILSVNGFEVYWNRLVPSGDSGIALGQAYLGLKDNKR